MDKSLIFDKLQKKKSENLEIIENLYADDIFANYYHSIVDQDALLEDDIDEYKQFFDKKWQYWKLVVELGESLILCLMRVTISLAWSQQKKWRNTLLMRDVKRIYKLTLQEIEKFPLKDIEVIIIPATSVSLFSHEEFFDFFEKGKRDTA